MYNYRKTAQTKGSVYLKILHTKGRVYRITGHTKDIEYRKTVYTKDNLYCYKGPRTHAPYHDRFHLDLFLICILWPR